MDGTSSEQPRPGVVGGRPPAARTAPPRTSARKNAKPIRTRAGRGNIYLHHGGYRAEIMVDGERLRRVFPTEEAAQAFLEEQVKRSVRFGISLDKARITLRQLFALFLEAKEVQGLKRTTLQDYKNSIAYWTHAYGDLPVQHLQAAHVTRLMAQMRRGITTANVAGEVVTKRPASPKQIANVRALLRAALRFAVDQDIVDRNVVDKTRAPRLDRPQPKGWPRETARAFLDAIAGERLGAMFHVFLSTGARKGELCALKWTDVDLATGQVTIQRRLVRVWGGTGIDIDAPKTDASIRTATLAAEALAKLTAWQAQQESERRAAGDRWVEGDWIFTTRHGTHLEPRWVSKHFADLLKDRGFAHLSVHGLRHTFCTVLLAANVPIKDVQEIAGHSRPSVTLNMYNASIPGSGGRVAKKMDELLGSVPESQRDESE